MVQINTDSFAKRVEELKQEEEARKANLPSNFAKMIKPQPGSTVFFTSVVLTDEQVELMNSVNHMVARDDEKRFSDFETFLQGDYTLGIVRGEPSHAITDEFDINRKVYHNFETAYTSLFPVTEEVTTEVTKEVDGEEVTETVTETVVVSEAEVDAIIIIDEYKTRISERATIVGEPVRWGLSREMMFREVQEANLYDEPKWTDRVMTPVIVGKSDEQYGYKEWTLSDGEMVYFQLPATVRIQLYNHVQDEDMDYEPLLVTQDGIVLNGETATAFKLHRDDSGAITSYSTLILTAKASSKYIPETVDVAPEAFDEYIDGYKVWQQSRFDKATGNTQNDSENTADSL